MQHVKGVEHVIWDWNGTLLDDVSAALAALNQVLVEHSLTPLADEEAYRSVFDFPIVDYYARVGFDCGPGGNFEAAAHRYIEVYGAKSRTCALHATAPGTIDELDRRGVAQVILSAARRDHLMLQINRAGLDPLRFSDVLGLNDIYAHSKVGLAQTWIAESGLDPARMLMVGDTAHDLEVANAMGVSCVLYSGGHHPRSRLGGLGVPVIDSLDAVLDFVVSGPIRSQ